DANATIAAAPVSCPSCGAPMVRAITGQVPVDEAVTHRLQESPKPDPTFTEAPTAILAPPTEPTPSGATPPLSSCPHPISPPTPTAEEPDQYRTASVSESDPAMPSASATGDPSTQPMSAVAASSAVAPTTGAGAGERRDGWRNPLLVTSMIM